MPGPSSLLHSVPIMLISHVGFSALVVFALIEGADAAQDLRKS